MAEGRKGARSAFDELGLKAAVRQRLDEIKELYLSDEVPWVLGYSGGKDSTASLQLVWTAVSEIPADRRHKTIHVISTDTLVENPIVASWVNHSLEAMGKAANETSMQLEAHRLTPEVSNSFWVNLIGKGYPAPRPRFRWCTERLKIKPSNRFITDMVRKSGEVILVLGTRKAESASRAKSIQKHSRYRVRDRLSPNSTLPNCMIFSPVEDWSNDDVWMYLMQVDNPWGYNNKELLTMYQGASEDGECPLVVDTTTPSCGDSRFGCWVCTVVDQDKSMKAMITNDDEKLWMEPMLKLRNELGDTEKDRERRDFRRMNGLVQIVGSKYMAKGEEPENTRLIHGPYTQEWRVKWLTQLLEAQRSVQQNGPEEVRDLELITINELKEIRRIWISEKHELEDMLPQVYETVFGQPFPGHRLDDSYTFGAEEIQLLKDLCENPEQFALTRELLGVEQKFRTQSRRSGLFKALEQSIRKHFYDDEEDAKDRAVNINRFKKAASEGDLGVLAEMSNNAEVSNLED